ncbi:AAA family ATPase [Rhizobium sp. CRIBSB]|nr:AAA family ATPase [Rhizobium sp. CRIBSB]
MSTAFASSVPDAFEDEFELDMSYGNAVAAGPDAVPGDPEVRSPLQFTAPVAAAAAGPASAPPVPQEPFNPVGDLMAGAGAAFQAPVPASYGPQVTEVSVPRIAIHVFAERQDTLAAAERAGQDRRLSRATTQIRVGGVMAAIEAYRHEPTPPLIVVECLKDPQTLLWEVDQLAEVCDAGTKVVVVGATNDILLFRELMRRGVSEYLVAPLQPLQLIAAIGGLFADPAQPFIGRSIAFVGARGGAGASSVAHNTAYAMSERIGANTVIVDYDLPFGTAGLDFNQDPLNGVADALSQPDRLDAVLLDRMMVRCTDKLSLFAAPATLDNDWDASPEAFEEVTTRIRSTAPFVVLDLPHVWNTWIRRTLIAADEVVVVATPDLASLRNAKNMIDLIRQGRPNDAPPRLVLNQVGVPGRPEIPAKDFGAALGVHPSLIIPFDPKVFGSAANNGQMILDLNGKSKASEAFQTLAQIVSRRELPAVTGPKGKPASEKGSLLAGLFKKKS